MFDGCDDKIYASIRVLDLHILDIPVNINDVTLQERVLEEEEEESEF
jgi:hypothetical protein